MNWLAFVIVIFAKDIHLALRLHESCPKMSGDAGK